jgi:hypothetical protein
LWRLETPEIISGILLGIFGIFGCQVYRPEIPEIISGIRNNFPNRCSGISGSGYTGSGSGISGSGFGFYARSDMELRTRARDDEETVNLLSAKL